MKKTLVHNRTVALTLVSVVAWCLCAVGMRAQTCVGRVCLKGGDTLSCSGDDRMDMPRKKRDLQVYRNFFSRQCKSEEIAYANIDSVVVWNASSPQNKRILVPLGEVGWCWLYISHPKLDVYVYATQGYSLSSMGGMTAVQGAPFVQAFFIPAKTTCDFYVVSPGGKPVCLGDTYKAVSKAFVTELCRCAGLPEGCVKQLLKSGINNRSTMIQAVLEMLDDKQSNPIDNNEENNQNLLAASRGGSGGYGLPGSQE